MRQIQTCVRIDEVGRRHSLRIIDMNRPGQVQALIIIIHQMAWAIGCTQTASRTVVRNNITGTHTNGCGKFPWLSIKGQQISVAYYLDIWRPTGLNKLRSQDSERTVIGWKSFV